MGYTALSLELKQDVNITIVSVTGAVALTSSAFGKWHELSGTSADYTVGLPTAVGNSGKTIGFKGLSTFTKIGTVDGNGSETIDGSLTKTVTALGGFVLISNGANWDVLNQTPSVPAWIDWSSSLNPTGITSISIQVAQYRDDGVTVEIQGRIFGASSGTTMTITLPAAVHSSYTSGRLPICFLTNNSVNTNGVASLTASSTAVSFLTSAAGALTASGNRGAEFGFSYRKA